MSKSCDLFTAARLGEIDDQWNNLVDLASLRKQRLNEAVDFYQFVDDANDFDHWMGDTLRLVSSGDVDRDEASAQSLLKKHRVSHSQQTSAMFNCSFSVCLCRSRLQAIVMTFRTSARS